MSISPASPPLPARAVTCPHCGQHYLPGSAQACGGCPLHRGPCGLLRCPHCHYESAGESQLWNLLERALWLLKTGWRRARRR